MWRREKAAADSPLRRRTAPHNNALKLTKRGILSVGALRAPPSLSLASQLSAVFCGPPGRA